MDVLAWILAVAAWAGPECSGDVVSTLYVGRDIAAGGHVSGRAWKRFLKDEVAEHVGGYTAWRATGGWFDGERVVHEDSYVLRVVHPLDHDATIEAIAEAYAVRFGQTSVLWTRSDTCVRWVAP